MEVNMTESDGRHGGNHGRTDRGEAKNEREQASLNTDVDSRRTPRDQNEAEGHTSGRK
jgi:hypothetical protein